MAGYLAVARSGRLTLACSVRPQVGAAMKGLLASCPQQWSVIPAVYVQEGGRGRYQVSLTGLGRCAEFA